MIRPGEEILFGNGRRLRVLNVVAFDEEEDSAFVVLLQVEAVTIVAPAPILPTKSIEGDTMERRMVYVRASEAQEAQERARLRAVEAERNYADAAREYSAAMADLGYDPRVGAVLEELHNRLVGG